MIPFDLMGAVFGPNRDKIVPTVVKIFKKSNFYDKNVNTIVNVLSYMVFTATNCIGYNMNPFSHARTLKTARKLKLGPREKCGFLRVFS